MNFVTPAKRAPGYHGDDRWLLLWAALIGVVGALATVAFHEAMALAERLATGHPGGLVSAAQALPMWQRAITPALGGLAAGLILWLARRINHGRKQSEYLEAIAVGLHAATGSAHCTIDGDLEAVEGVGGEQGRRADRGGARFQPPGQRPHGRRLGEGQHPRRREHRNVAGADGLRRIGVGDGQFELRRGTHPGLHDGIVPCGRTG